jgi:hypothetical protein
MLLKNRVFKLERGNLVGTDFPKVLFRAFVSPGNQNRDIRMAHIIGKGLSLKRRPEECEAEFVQRVYVECVKAYGLDKAARCTLSDDDLAMIAATASPELALKHLRCDDLTHDDLPISGGRA